MRTSKHHHQLDENKEGKCSVPMWSNGLPAGFCDEVAYGEPVPCRMFRTSWGEIVREDGKYAGFVPGLACPGHGGPEKKLSAETAHKGDPCIYCKKPHDAVAVGPCPKR